MPAEVSTHEPAMHWAGNGAFGWALRSIAKGGGQERFNGMQPRTDPHPVHRSFRLVARKIERMFLSVALPLREARGRTGGELLRRSPRDPQKRPTPALAGVQVVKVAPRGQVRLR